MLTFFKLGLAAEFNWDDVKADKHRENYLGHSLKAPVGRWQKGKNWNKLSETLLFDRLKVNVVIIRSLTLLLSHENR